MWTPIHEQKTHAIHVLMLTNTDHFLLHFLKIIVCYVERNVANGTAHCIILYQRSPPCHCSKTQSQHGQNNKHEPSHPIIMSWVIVYWKGSLHMSLWWLREVVFQNMKWRSVNVGLYASNVLKYRVHSKPPNMKVARLDYNVNWNIITSPAQCLCLWHNSTGGFERGETCFALTNGTSQKNSGIYYTDAECKLQLFTQLSSLYIAKCCDDRMTVF